MGAVGAVALVLASAWGLQESGTSAAKDAAQLTRPNATSVRICLIALYEYEKHTLFHHLAYHRLIGVESAWVYIDDRTADPPESAAWLEALRSWDTYVRVFPWTTTRVGNQDEARGHCIRTTEAARDVDWLTFPDGDEYMHFGAPRHRRGNGSSWEAWSLASVLRGVPDHLLGLIMPRLFFNDVSSVKGVPRTPVPPTETLGPFFFEPQVYMRTLAAAGEERSFARCWGKPIIRVGRGVGAWQHTVIELYPPSYVSNGSLEIMPYPAPLTSLRANRDCAFGNDGVGGPERYARFLKAGGQWPRGVDLTDVEASAHPENGNALLKLYEYGDLQLYHYYSRSYAECRLKKYRQGHGRDATIALGGPKQHRTTNPMGCHIKLKATTLVSGLGEAAQAAQDLVHSVWPRLAELVPVDTSQWRSPHRPEVPEKGKHDRSGKDASSSHSQPVTVFTRPWATHRPGLPIKSRPGHSHGHSSTSSSSAGR